MSYGVQDDGSFDRKYIDEIVDDLKTELKNRAGSDIDLEQGSPIKQIIDLFAIEHGRQWQATEETYYSSFYEDAFGVQLDKLLALAGVSRIPRRGATGEVTFSTDTANSTDVDIPSGTRVETEPAGSTPAIPFKTTEAATLPAGNTSVSGVSIEALEPHETSVEEKFLGAETNVASNTIVNIVNPISGVDSVTNPNPTGDTSLDYVQGRDEESDPELKVRYENSLAASGDATLDAIRAEVYNRHQEITNVKMRENTSTDDNTASGGLPPKSFEATVLYTGSHANDVAQAILDSRPAGIESYGSASGTAESDDGDVYTENFETATQIDIYVDVTATSDGTADTNADKQIEDEIIKYIGGVTNDGIEYPGLEIGDTLVYDQVFAQAMFVSGIREVDVTVGTSDNPTGTANISIGDTEVARSNVSWIDVTVN